MFLKVDIAKTLIFLGKAETDAGAVNVGKGDARERGRGEDAGCRIQDTGFIGRVNKREERRFGGERWREGEDKSDL